MKNRNIPIIKLALLSFALVASLLGEETTVAMSPTDASYDLTRCIETALARNFEIQKAKEQIRKQHGLLVEVRAALIPHLSATGNLQKTDPDRLQEFGGGFRGSDTNWTTDITITQTIFAGGRHLAATQKEYLMKQAAFIALRSVVNDVVLQVRERYFDALLAEAQIQVQEQNVKLLEEELRSAQNKLKAGTVPQFNVLRAEVALANGRAPLIRARNNLRLAIEELRRVIGLRAQDGGPAELVLRGELRFDPITLELEQAQTLALQNRPELKRNAKLVDAQKYGVRQATGGYAPRISVFGGYGWEKSRFSDELDDELHGWVVGVNATWDIFDGAATHGRILQAKADLATAKLQERQGQQDVAVEVRRAHNLLIEAVELVGASREVVKQAEESVRLARSRFDVGSGTQLDVLDSQVALTEARTNEIRALYDYNIARARLQKAIGITEKFNGTEKTDAAQPKENEK